ncbi:MAG: AtpZ/AtpI family protein [Flavobacteriaceae bacterium]|nr:AtpZ/AtpI family protein [Flavobacteriaceae bacterium]
MPNQDKPLKNLAALSGLGIQMGVIVGVFTFIGLKLDQFFLENSTDLFTLGFVLIGIFLSMVYVIKRVNKSSKK